MKAHELRGPKDIAIIWLDDCFNRILALNLWGRNKAVQDWLSEVGEHRWPRIFVQRFADTVKKLADAILMHRQYSLVDFYSAYTSLPRADFKGRDGSYEFWQIARQTLTDLGLDSVLLAANGTSPCLDRESVEFVFSSPHCYWADWISEYVRWRRTWLCSDAADWIVEKYGDNTIVGIEELKNYGVSEATILANLMALHRRRKQAHEYLFRAVDLSFTYGNHKDILLSDYLDAVALIGEHSPELACREIKPVIPAILHLSDFTDGDETRHIPGQLFDLLVKLRPAWLPSVYHYLYQHEAYRNAEEAFRRLMRSMAFDSPLEVGLGSTCLDEESQKEITEKANGGSTGAKQVLASIQQEFGISPFPPKKTDQGYSSAPYSAEHPILPNGGEYPPDRIVEYWQALGAPTYSGDKDGLRKWVEFWENRTGPESVLNALVRLQDDNDLVACAGLIHDLTVRVQGRKAAWPWLIKAHREVHGWSTHWTSETLAQEKWEIVARHYPERWLDFMVETMTPGRWSWEGIGIWNRLTRIVKYLLLLNHNQEAEAVVQGVREVIEGLVAPFRLGISDWLEDGKTHEDQLLGVLLARLTWPSGMVRERACTALAELLTGGEDGQRVSSALIEWIQRQNLESVACLGLLPFVKAIQLTPEARIPDHAKLRDACQCPSLLYEILLEELIPGAGQELLAGVGHTKTAPRDFQPSTKFNEHHEHSLPTIYQKQADSLERQFGVKFQRQWAYEVEHTGDGLRNAYTTVNFWGQPDGEHFAVFDTPLSEGLRSGYLRALAWLAEKGDDQRFWAMREALKVLPIDLGLWIVHPKEVPDWWPLRKTIDNQAIDTVPISIFESVGKLWDRQCHDDWLLGMANGRVAEGDVLYDLEIFAIFQKCLGPKTPEAEAFYESEPWWRQLVHLEPIGPWLRGVHHRTPGDNVIIRLADWQVVPCILHGYMHTVARWQWWRLLRSIWLPLPAIAHDSYYRVDCQQERVVINDSEGELAFWQDWTAGVSELQDANLTPRTGQYLMIRRSLIERFAAVNGSVYCWACRIKWFQRKHGAGNYDKFSICRVIGASNLVLPETTGSDLGM